MQNKNYYSILGVQESASAEDIKKVYRKLAVQFHPDKNKGDKKAEEKFKEISEAYYVLGDPKRRQEYDQMRRFGGGAGPNFAGAHGFNFEDLLRQFGSGRGRSSSGGQYSVFGDVFEDLLRGGGSGRGRSPYQAYSGGARSPFGGAQEVYEEEADQTADVVVDLKISAEKAKNGGQVSFKTPEGQTISVKIPANTTLGKKLKLVRQGHVCSTCHHRGDLILRIKF